MRWTEQQVAALQKTGGRQTGPIRVGKPSKYRNTPKLVDGIRFASKKEANYYEYLKLKKACNGIRGFTRQVSLPLASHKRRMVIDFMIVECDGRVRFVDVKGFITPEWKTKKIELEHSLGITIETA